MSAGLIFHFGTSNKPTFCSLCVHRARDRDVVERAAQATLGAGDVAIMRAFVRLREMLSSHEELRRKIDAVEKRYDARFQAVFETIRRMPETPIPAKKTIGFHAQIGSPAKSG